jgi:hypothetical protein
VDTLRGRGAKLLDAYFKTEGPVVHAWLTDSKIGDAEVAMLRSIPSLQSIILAKSKVTDAGLTALSNLGDVHTLSLTDTAISDAGLVHIRKMRGLRTLSIDGTSVTDAGMETLKGHPTLRFVDIRRTRVTEAGVATLKVNNASLTVSQETRYYQFTGPDGRWSAAFPWKKPGSRTRTQMTPFGRITDTVYEVEQGTGSAMVAVADLAAAPLDRVNPEDVANSGRDAVAATLGATVAKDERKVSGETIVRDVVLDIRGRNGQGPAYFRYVIDGRRLYTLAILSNGLSIPEAEKNRFFNSFKIVR